ncbi:MAG TPA: carbohydrate kinase [Polyangiaceae bacterium]|nr:carbohydrate kinase [Polyangiaceae bacterium]
MKPRLDVAAFGEVLWDLFELPERGGARLYRRELGGAPCNVAVALARLGLRASIVGAVGKDSFGADLAAALEAQGVDVSSLSRLPNRTGIAFVRRDARGEPSFLFYRHDTADMALAPRHLEPRMAKATFALLGTSTLVREPLRAATRRFVQLARRAGTHLVVDLNVRAHLWDNPATMRARIAELVKHAAVVKGSSVDLRALGGPRFLAEHAPRAAVVVTAGADPARAFGPFGEVERPARRARCVDATGAGDAFVAGVLAVLARRRALPGSAAFADPRVFSEALDVGHMLGHKVVSKVGAVSGLVRLDAVRAKLEMRT